MDQLTLRNRLIGNMSPSDFALVRDDLEFLSLPKTLLITEVDQPIEFAVFPEDGVCSIIAVSPEGHEVESGLYGFDGMGPVALLLDVDQSTQRIIVQVPGEGHRISAAALKEACGRSVTLHNLLLRYVQVLNLQVTYTALSNAAHSVEERLARWILMCHDRSQSDDIAMTHDFLSIMLAVRRPTVTTLLHALEGNGFIQSTRGFVTVLNRAELEDYARDVYGKPEAEYRRLIGPMRT